MTQYDLRFISIQVTQVRAHFFTCHHHSILTKARPAPICLQKTPERQRVLAPRSPALLVGCAQPATGGDDLAARPIRVVATTGMVGDLVRNVGGERVEVVTLMGPGVDPHLYKASADDVVQLQRSVVSLTAVGAFNAVGSVLVVALMVAPPAAAYLLTDRLPRMLALSALFGALAAILGCWAAFALNASIAGAMAVVTGLIFCLAWMFAPQRGLLAQVVRRVRQRWEFAQAMLAVHLLHHQATAQAVVECQAAHLSEHLNWSPRIYGTGSASC